MSLLKLPEIRADASLAGMNFDLRQDAIESWEPEIQAAASDPATSISIYGTIGAGPDGQGVTARGIAAALRSIGPKDVSVNINSPGGNYFEGVAIYNLLRQHNAKVTVNVLGLAASAASVAAMAGDEILMGEGARLMIHNAWGIAVGNRHDMQAAIESLAPLDADMANVYSQRSGVPVERVAAMMDEETFISADKAIAQGFATGHLEPGKVGRGSSGAPRKAMALVESALAQAGYSRSARRDTFKTLFSGMPSAATQEAMPSAGDETAAQLQNLITTIRG